MPGGGSLLAANHIFNVAAKDGTTLGLIVPTAPLEERLGAVERSLRGRAVQLDRAAGADAERHFHDGVAPVNTIQDAMPRESVW